MISTNKHARRLAGMPHAQACWIDWAEDCAGLEQPVYTLYSYNSRILDVMPVTDDEYVISIDGADAAINYSRTTSKQVTFALREYLRDDLVQAVKRALTDVEMWGATRVFAVSDGVIALNGKLQDKYLYNA